MNDSAEPTRVERNLDETKDRCSVGSSLLDGLIALVKVSMVPILSYLLTAIIVGVISELGGDERYTLLFTCLVLIVLTTANAIAFWRFGMRLTAVIGGGLWVAYSLLGLFAVVAFWGG